MQIKDVIDKDIKGLWGEEAVEGEENTPVIKTNNLSYEGVISYGDLTYRLIDIDKAKKNYLQKGDLLIEKSGGTKTHSVGYISYFDGDNDKYVCNNFILALRPNGDLIVPKYLFYNIRYLYESGNFDDCFNKTTGIQNLKTDRYLSKTIPERTIDEQKEIAKKLDLIVNVIENKRKELTLLDELIKSRFIGLFGLPIDNTKNWDTCKAEEACQLVTDGSHFSPKASETGYPMLSVKDMRQNGFDYSDCKFIDEETYKTMGRQGCVPLVDDVLIAKDGSYFTRAFPIKEFKEQAILSSIGLYRPDTKKILPQFLASYLMSNEVINYVNKSGYVTGTALHRVIIKGLKNIPVYLPPIELQKEYCEFVEKVDKSKFKVQESLNKTQLLFDSLMQEYFG